MRNQDQNAKDAKTLSPAGRDAVEKVAEPQEIGRELTDDEIAAVAGGTTTKMTGTKTKM
jgi:hypothetical protein